MRATLILFSREVRKWFSRRPVLVISLMTPIFWIALFGKSLNLFNLVQVGDAGVPAAAVQAVREAIQARIVEIFGTLDYFTYVASGIIVVFALFQSLFGGVGIVFDKRLGYMNRLLVAPIPRQSIFLAKIMGTLFRITVLSVILVTLAAFLGFQFKEGITPLDLLGAWLVLMTLSIGIASVFATIAFYTNNHEVVFSVANLVNLPLMFTSSALFPVEQMPGWLKAIARVNPLTYAADLERYFLVGKPVEDPALYAALLVALSAALFAGGLYASLRAMDRGL